MEEAHHLHLLGSVSKLSSGRHPSLRPRRFRNAGEVEGIDTLRCGVDIPRVKDSKPCLIYQPHILRPLNQQVWIVGMSALEFDVVLVLL